MLDSIAQRWMEIIQTTRNRWRWLGNLLSITAFVFLVFLLVYSGYQVKDIEWKLFWVPILLSLAISLFSQSLQFLVWARMISSFKKINLKDFNIYARFLLMKRLPGGIWQWIGRSSLYSDQVDIPGKSIITASFLEWLLLIICGALLVVAGIPNIDRTLSGLVSIVLLGIGITLAFRWQKNSSTAFIKLAESILWIMLYLISWILGGMIIHILSISAGGAGLGWLKAIWIWTTAATISFFIVFIPAGLGIREITLTWLLIPYLEPSQAVIVSVLMRLILMGADTIWGIVGFTFTPLRMWLIKK